MFGACRSSGEWNDFSDGLGSCSVICKLMEKGILQGDDFVELGLYSHLTGQIRLIFDPPFLRVLHACVAFLSQWPLSAAGDNDRVLKEAAAIRAMLVAEQCSATSSKEKARATAAWSALMFTFLLNKTQAHLIHSGCSRAACWHGKSPFPTCSPASLGQLQDLA